MKKKNYIIEVIIILSVLTITFSVVNRFRKPGQMTVLESQSADMAAMVAPKGAVPVAVQRGKK